MGRSIRPVDKEDLLENLRKPTAGPAEWQEADPRMPGGATGSAQGLADARPRNRSSDSVSSNSGRWWSRSRSRRAEVRTTIPHWSLDWCPSRSSREGQLLSTTPPPRLEHGPPDRIADLAAGIELSEFNRVVTRRLDFEGWYARSSPTRARRPIDRGVRGKGGLDRPLTRFSYRVSC
jgi:hypothetical protein